jgi:hypothetical protein
MKGSLAGMALLAILLQLSCGSAHAVTAFDSNVRPDGANESAQAPANAAVTVQNDDGSSVQIVQAAYGEGEAPGDTFDVTDTAARSDD